MRFLARAISVALLLLLIFAASRALIRALPGDPLSTLMAESGTSLSPEVVRKELGLDRPFVSALVEDLARAAHGDLGISIISRQPIAPLLFKRIAQSAVLALASFALGLLISLTLGLSAAARPHGGADRACNVITALTSALPAVFIGPALLFALTVWIPIVSDDEGWVLPAVTLAICFSGLWAQLIRSRVRDGLALPSAAAARARGIPEWKVVLKYGFAPGAGSIAAYLGTQLGHLVAGVWVAELVFNRKGLGLLLRDGVLKRDYPLLEAAIFASALFALLGTAIGDIAQNLLDPRIRLKERAP